jgi:hypothetical protein
LKKPARIRAPINNHFAHGIALQPGLRWYNRVALATRKLAGSMDVKIPDGFEIRKYHSGTRN